MKGKILKIEVTGKSVFGIHTTHLQKTFRVIVEIDAIDWIKAKDELHIDEECAIHAPRGASTDKRHDK